MVKRYKKSRRRTRRRFKKTRRRYRKKSVWKTAKAAARSVMKSTAAPLFVRKIYGQYNELTGQFDNQIALPPGPTVGYLDDSIPKISIPANTQLLGDPSYRSDMEITITGISAQFRIQLPQNLTNAVVKLYLFIDKQFQERVSNADPLLESQFKTPNEYYMLRDDNNLRADMHNIRVLATKTIRLNSLPGSGGGNMNRVFRDMKIWWKPKKGFKLKYQNSGVDDVLNRNIGLCLKASYPDNANQDRVTFGGVVTTYYRDYS